MAEINGGVFHLNETNERSNGGTERLTRELSERANPELLKHFQIVSSRVRKLDDEKIRIFWAHDLPGDPESNFLTDKNNHDMFHMYVFVSNWQMQSYINQYDLPWSKCVVLQNAIDPIQYDMKKFNDEQIRLIYTSTPHRGLHLLYPAVNALSKQFPNIHLDVFSSFGLYGWESRDEPYQQLFDSIRDHSHMTYHGAQPNAVVRDAVSKAHVFTYPSIWPETSCLCLIEAMSAGLICVHSNYGALYETARGYNMMYQYHENQRYHVVVLYESLKYLLENYETVASDRVTSTQSSTTNDLHDWQNVVRAWEYLLYSLLQNPTDR